MYGEAGYTDDQLSLFVFADIKTAPLLSYGVKVSYDSLELIPTSAAKNEAAWYLGNGRSQTPYPDPVTSVGGDVLFHGFRLDTLSPLSGVTGTKVLLGVAWFDRNSPGLPSLSLDYARKGDFKNFVTVGSVVLDGAPGGVSFGAVSFAPDDDQDGLSNAVESAFCTDPNDADTDDDGLPDGEEDVNHNGAIDPGELNPCSEDSDNDGIQDGTELGLTQGVADPDGAGPLLGTDLGVFVPDQDPTTRTDPLDDDTDDDGMSDGEEDLNRNGRLDSGETDPLEIDSSPVTALSPLSGCLSLLILFAAGRYFLRRDKRFAAGVFLLVLTPAVLVGSSSYAFGAGCPGDFNGDGDVDGSDMAAFAEDYGRTDCAGDCEGDFEPDGDVDDLDLAVFAPDLSRWDCPHLPASAPEAVDYGYQEDEQEGGAGLVGETVRIPGGNMIESRSDFQFPSPHSLGLGLEVYYNSRSGVTGAMGRGWSHTYMVTLDSSCRLGGVDVIRLRDATGREMYFREESPGVYRGVYGEKSRIEEDGGRYVWHRLDGSAYGFDTTGRLSWMDDEKGNRLSLTYNPMGLVETVTDASSGRVLGFSYNGGVLDHVTGPATTAVGDGIWVGFGYDGNDNLTSVLYADGSGFDYTYTDPHDPHNVTEKRNKADHLLNTWGYDSEDRVVSNFSVDGRGVSIVYASDTQVEVTDAYGTTRTYTIAEKSGHNRVIAVSGIANAPYAGNNAVRWEYDSALNLVEVEYEGGAITRYLNHDDRGNAGRVVLASGTEEERSIDFTYHPEMNAPLTRTEESNVVGPAGHKKTTWDYDGDGDSVPNEDPTNLVHRVVERGYTTVSGETDVPYEYVTAMEYNPRGQLESIDGPRPGTGDTTTYSYDPATGDLLSIARPMIGGTDYSHYDGVGMPGRVTDVNGNSRDYVYDGRSRVIQVTNIADASTTHTSYNTAGKVEATTDEDGVVRTYSYDATHGRLERITDMQGNSIRYQYDSQGNRIEMSKHDPVETRTFRKRWDYQHPDMPGLLWKEITGGDPPTVYGYDPEGNVNSTTDPEGRETLYTYDILNRLETVTQPTQPVNAVTTYDYNRFGSLRSVIDAEGHATTYLYDDMGRAVTVSSPDPGMTAYEYDEAGNLISKTDARGITATYSYDDLNRLTHIIYPDPGENVAYFYDAGVNGMGRRTGITDQSGSITFSYDARGRLTTKESSVLGQVYTFDTDFSESGRVSKVTYPSGRTLDYTRDTMGRMEGLSTTSNSITRQLVSNMTYQPFGTPKGLQTGSGAEVANQSSECGCIEVGNPGEDMECVYGYDANRNLTSKTYTNHPRLNQGFGYDEIDRLVHAEGSYGVIDYTYDKAGNRLTRSRYAAKETCTYIPGTNKIDQVTGPKGTVDFAYDSAGNITFMGGTTFYYNQGNRMVRAEGDGGVLGDYAYNALGQRVYKVVSGVTTVFHYDHGGKLIAESRQDGTFSTEYLFVGTIRMALVDVSGNSMYYYLNDHLGTPQRLTDETNTVVWEASYMPFGKAWVNPHSSVTNNIRFPGQYMDQETGLHYNYHRYYDPGTGRYLRKDPLRKTIIDRYTQIRKSSLLSPRSSIIDENETHLTNNIFIQIYLRNPQLINAYVYVENDPVNLVDFYGLMGRKPDPGKARPNIPFYPPKPIPCDPFKWCEKKYKDKLALCAGGANPPCVTNAKLWLENCLFWAAGVDDNCEGCVKYGY